MKSLVVSVCITAVTDMAAVSLLVFFWCSAGFFWVLLAVFWRASGVLLAFFCVIEHQKNARRTPEEHQKERQKNPEEPRRRRTPAPPLFEFPIGGKTGLRYLISP